MLFTVERGEDVVFFSIWLGRFPPKNSTKLLTGLLEPTFEEGCFVSGALLDPGGVLFLKEGPKSIPGKTRYISTFWDINNILTHFENINIVMICYDTWLCKSNPSVVVSLFLGTGTFKYWSSLALSTDHRESLLLYLIDIFDAGVMQVGGLLSMLRLMLRLVLSMLRLVSVLRRAGVVLGVILVMLDWLLCVSVQQLTTNLLR